MLREGGRFRYLAPELTSGTTEKFRTAQASDIFSLGMTFLHTWTRRRPFDEVDNDLQVAAEYRGNRRPARPIARIVLPSNIEEEFWTLLGTMWTQEPESRPSSEALRKNMELLFPS